MAKEIKNLQKLLNKSGIKGEVVEQKSSYLVSPGENFGSLILKVDITLKEDGKETILHTVAKCVPPNPMTQAIFQTHVTFKNEIYWYSTIIPEFISYQQECGMEETAEFFQKMYAARISLDDESNTVDIDGLLLTENLVTAGYRVYDRQIGFDYETSKLLLKNLAIFHAVFLGLKVNKPELFKKNIYPYIASSGPPVNEETPAENPFTELFEVLKVDLDLQPYIPRVQENAKKFDFFALEEDIDETPWLSVSHNDFWTNNVMIKDSPPKQVKFLDFQITKYKSVAADVIFFLLTSVQIDTYTEHFEELLENYYDVFLKTLSQVKVDCSEYSFQKFLDEISREAECGQFIHAFYHTIFLMASKDLEGRKYAAEENTDMMGDIKKISSNLNEKHREKFTFLILEAIKRNWI